VLIHLEWDRGTEQPRRLRAKLHAYTGYFADRPGASANQVLFVAPTEQRERQISYLLPDHSDAERESCRFWTTTTAFIAAAGPLGAVWAGGGSRREMSVFGPYSRDAPGTLAELYESHRRAPRGLGCGRSSGS